MVRCKAYGYLMPAGKLRDKCPACGAPSTAFEPYADTMSPERRRILKLDLHPIAVHFPISFTVAVFIFSIAVPFLSGDPQTFLIQTNKVLVLFIPVIVVATFWLGWIDGKIRFRKIKNSQILQRKIAYANLLFAVSSAQTVVMWIYGFSNSGFSALIALLGMAAFVLILLLSLLGINIKDSAFPGK